MRASCPKEQERKLRRALSNRKSARKSRQKKKEMINRLSVNYKAICILNEKMEEELNRLRRQVQGLEHQLEHKLGQDPNASPNQVSRIAMEQTSTVSMDPPATATGADPISSSVIEPRPLPGVLSVVTKTPSSLTHKNNDHGLCSSTIEPPSLLSNDEKEHLMSLLKDNSNSAVCSGDQHCLEPLPLHLPDSL